MKLIGTKTHGYLDYLTGILLLVLPSLAGWDLRSPASVVPMVLGAFTILYSLMTNYELGIAKIISVRTHLAIDFLSGLFLAASPWLFGFSDAVWGPHVVVGIIEIIVSLITKARPNTIINTTTTGRTTGTTTI